MEKKNFNKYDVISIADKNEEISIGNKTIKSRKLIPYFSQTTFVIRQKN